MKPREISYVKIGVRERDLEGPQVAVVEVRSYALI
jgi:hypothetical protein